MKPEDFDLMVKALTDLAKEISTKDPLEFPVGLNKEEVYQQICKAVLQEYYKTAEETRELILLGTTVHLLVENTIMGYSLLLEDGR